MTQYLSVIQSAPIFSGIKGDDLETMLRCLEARIEHYPKETYLLRTGEEVDSFKLMLSGGALIVQEDYWGNRNIVSHIDPGQLFAESFACSPGSALSVSVVAERPCAILHLNVRRILTACPNACGGHSQLIQNLIADLAGKNLRFSEKITHMGQRTTREKILSYLSAEARRQGASAFDIPFSRQQLADYLSVERSGLSAELSKMRREGIFTFHKNHFSL